MANTEPNRRLVITGATGTVGEQVVRALRDRDAEVVAAVRDPDAAAEQLGEDIKLVEFDFTRPETWGFAFQDADGLFLVRPPGEASLKGDLLPAVDAAVRSGIDHVVFLSVAGADRIPVLPHRRIERHIEGLGVDYTFLRAAFFMQNLSEVHRQDVVERDEIFVPAGNGETVFVDARDVGAVGAAALTGDGHRNRAYEVTGSDKMDYYEVAAVFSEVLGREITYAAPGPVEFVRRTYGGGTDLGFAVAMLFIYAPTRFGLTGEPTDTVEQILGREPYTVREFVSDYRDVFGPSV